jgi:RNA polymerase sigma-70 factor (ECF subfamily)
MEQVYIRRILEGDIAKFSWFVETYKNLAWSIAFRITRNREDAEEVVQDSFLNAYRSLGKFKGEAKFSTWLTRIVVNNGLKKISVRKLDARPMPDDLPEIHAEDLSHAYQTMAAGDRKKFVGQALDQLELEDGLLLTLYYLQENTIAEIAEITAIPPENIKMKLHRGRKKMYLALQEILQSETKTIL